MSLLPLIMLIVLVFVVAISIGANDETMASVVGAKIITLNAAILLGAFLQVAGAQLLGVGVSKTIGQDMVLIDLQLDIVVILAISMTIWLLITSTQGYPISTTHSIVGCILGVGLWLEFVNHQQILNWPELFNIFAGWILSPIFGLIIAFSLQVVVRKFSLPRKTGLEQMQRLERAFGWLLIIMVVITSLSRGGNDVSKAVGILVMATPDPLQSTFGIPLIRWFLILGGVGMATGLFVIGRRVVATVGMEVTALKPSSSFSAEAGVAIVLLIGTLLEFPLSGTHVLITAVIGVGLANHTPIGGSAVKKIALASFLTVPLSAVFALGLLFLYLWIQPLLPMALFI